jgi:hypothetical protein
VTVPRWLPPAGIALAAGLFTWLNRGERAVVHLGIATFYRAPLTVVLFLAFLAGMLAMLALSLRHDLRVRQELRVRGLLVPVPAEGSPDLAPSPPAPLAHVPAAEPEETARFVSDDHTARFQDDGVGLRGPCHADGDGGEEDPTLIHQRDGDPPPRCPGDEPHNRLNDAAAPRLGVRRFCFSAEPHVGKWVRTVAARGLEDRGLAIIMQTVHMPRIRPRSRPG